MLTVFGFLTDLRANFISIKMIVWVLFSNHALNREEAAMVENQGIARGTVCVFTKPDGSEVQCRVDQTVRPGTLTGDPVFIVKTENGDIDAALPNELRPL